MISLLIPSAHLLLLALETIYRFSSVCLLTFDTHQMVLQSIDVSNTTKLHVIMTEGFYKNYTVTNVTLPYRAEVRRNAFFRKLKEACKPGDSLELKTTVATGELACCLLKKQPLKIRPPPQRAPSAAYSAKTIHRGGSSSSKRKQQQQQGARRTGGGGGAGGASGGRKRVRRRAPSDADGEEEGVSVGGGGARSHEYDSFYHEIEELQATEPSALYVEEQADEEEEDSRIIVPRRPLVMLPAAEGSAAAAGAVVGGDVSAATLAPLPLGTGTQTQMQVEWILRLADDYNPAFAQVDLPAFHQTASLVFTVVSTELQLMCKDLCVVGERMQVSNYQNTVTLHSLGEIGEGSFTCIDRVNRLPTETLSGKTAKQRMRAKAGGPLLQAQGVLSAGGSSKKSKARRRVGFCLHRAVTAVNATFPLRFLSLATEGFALSPEVQVMVSADQMVLHLRCFSCPGLDLYISTVATDDQP
jgi:hypothetical protein